MKNRIKLMLLIKRYSYNHINPYLRGKRYYEVTLIGVDNNHRPLRSTKEEGWARATAKSWSDLLGVVVTELDMTKHEK